MKKEMMIRSALIVSVALLSAACINKDGPTSQYELNILVPGEPSTLSEWIISVRAMTRWP